MTAKKVRIEAKKSLNECIASDIILILPDKVPAINLRTIITAFEVIESPAANFFSSIFCIPDIIAFFLVKVKLKYTRLSNIFNK